MNFPKYPEIALLKRRPEIMAVKEVIATEKLHGSNFRVGFPLAMTSLNDVVYGSRETEHTDPSFPLNNAIQWFRSRPDLLTAMWEVLKSYGFSDVTVFGEAFGPGIKAKGIKYSNGQEILFRAFDIMVGENFVTYDLFCEIVEKMGIPRVPEIWRGAPSVEAFDALLETQSVTAQQEGVVDDKNIAEGVVIRSNPLFKTSLGEWLIVKHKGSKFSEVAHAPSIPKERGVSPADTFAATYVTEGRVKNAVGRLQDRGVSLTNTMGDMLTLLKEVVADLVKECSPEMAEAGLDAKAITGATSRVLGPIYRGMLG